MPDEHNEILQNARERAERRLDTALGEIRQSIMEAAKRNRIPEGVMGHDVVDLLGRVMFVPALSRDLRREAGQIMAKQEIEALHAPPAARHAPAAPPPPPAAFTGGAPSIPVARNLADLPGVNVSTVKALAQAQLVTVGDVVNVPDEHLAKVTGLNAQAIGKLRAAIAKAATEAGA